MPKLRDSKGRFVLQPPSKFKGGTVEAQNIDKAVKSLKKDVDNVCFRTLKGMIAGGLILQRAAQQLTPVDTANLKASATTIWATKRAEGKPAFKGPNAAAEGSRHAKIVKEEKAGMSKSVLSPEVDVLFTASYGIYVHEDLEAKHKEGKQAKFLTAAAAANSAAILSAVKQEAKI